MTILPGIMSRQSSHARIAAAQESPARELNEVAGGSWQVTRLVHRGRWTTLYRARPGAAGDGPGCYVVKLSATPGNDEPIAKAMLRREASVAKGVNHPNLATVLAAHLRGEKPHLLLPFLEGATARRLITTSRAEERNATEGVPYRCVRALPVATALWIVRQVCEGLSALHESGWLHGQVRPEHVIVSPQGHATLIDLTLCRRLESDECAAGDSQTESLAYASPESITARGKLTAASDIYSLGLLLYELLAGRPGFEAVDAARLAEMHRRCAPPDVRSIRPDASLEVAQLLRLMLAKEPLRRPSDAELLRWLTELEIAALA